VTDDLGLHPSDRAILERRIRALVTPELVAEHAARAFGPHSPALEEVLHFLRRNPAPGVPRFVVHRRGAVRWIVGLKPERPGGPMRVVGDAQHPARDGAEHEVFRRRLEFYGLMP
jgi:hypothetical protein